MLGQIITSIITNIPDYSTLLNDTNQITNISFGVSDATITLNDTVDAGLTVGKYFIITGALFKNEIVSLTPVVGVGYQVETTVNHDLSEDYHDTVQITGFGGSWDDTFTIVSVDSPKEFTISTSLGAPVGTGYILEDRYNTIRGVQTITGATSSTLTFDTTTPFKVYDLTNAVINYNPRITAVYDIESAQRHFNPREGSYQNKPWAYVIYDSSAASKDTTIDSDARARHTKLEAVSQELDLDFDVVIFKENSERNTVRIVQDELLEFRYALLKSLLGLRIDFTNYANNERYIVSFLGDSPALYAGAYYAHAYSFQTQLLITTEETIENKDTAALRSFDIDLFLGFDDYEKVKKEIDMDFPS
jgi:hypothetical protein